MCKLALRLGSEALFTELNEHYVSINNILMSLIYEHYMCKGCDFYCREDFYFEKRLMHQSLAVFVYL